MASEADPMTLNLFYDSFYEDLNGEIREVTTEPEKTVVLLECDDWQDNPACESRRRFQFTCHGVLNSFYRTPHGWVVDIYPTEGMLIEQHYGSEWLDIYWKSPIENPHEILGRLYATHERLADRQCELRDYLVATEQTLKSAHGMLLSGPTGYAQNQMNVIKDLVSAYSCPSKRDSRTVTGIGFDESTLICEKIDFEEIGNS